MKIQRKCTPIMKYHRLPDVFAPPVAEIVFIGSDDAVLKNNWAKVVSGKITGNKGDAAM
jgi:hypothetical protein